METNKMVPFYIESVNGHDTKLVPEGNVAEEVNKQLQDKNWVTVEKADGNTEILTKPIETQDDLDEEDKKLVDDIKDKPKPESWANTFSGAKSATVTKPLKSG
jgi:hypothetical protein